MYMCAQGLVALLSKSRGFAFYLKDSPYLA